MIYFIEKYPLKTKMLLVLKENPVDVIIPTIVEWKDYTNEELTRAYDGQMVPLTLEIAQHLVGQKVYMLDGRDLYQSDPQSALDWVSLTDISRVEKTRDGYEIYATNKLFLNIGNPIKVSPDGDIIWGDGNELFIFLTK